MSLRRWKRPNADMVVMVVMVALGKDEVRDERGQAGCRLKGWVIDGCTLNEKKSNTFDDLKRRKMMMSSRLRPAGCSIHILSKHFSDIVYIIRGRVKRQDRIEHIMNV